MTLYHGSSVEVKEPLLLQNHRELDFGRGFYTTSDIEQAKRWAKRTTQRVKQKQSYVLFVKYLIANYWEYPQEALGLPTLIVLLQPANTPGRLPL